MSRALIYVNDRFVPERPVGRYWAEVWNRVVHDPGWAPEPWGWQVLDTEGADHIPYVGSGQSWPEAYREACEQLRRLYAQA